MFYVIFKLLHLWFILRVCEWVHAFRACVRVCVCTLAPGRKISSSARQVYTEPASRDTQ